MGCVRSVLTLTYLCDRFRCIQHVEAWQQVQQSAGLSWVGGGGRVVIHESGVCGGGQSASSFVLCLGCFGVLVWFPWRE